jgi:hypothetical protein
MICQIFDVLAKGVRDPSVARDRAAQQESRALFEEFCAQVRRGVMPEHVRPQTPIGIDKCRALLRGTGIHHALNQERERYLADNPRAATIGDGFRNFRLTPLHRPVRIDNPYLPPRPTYLS